MNNLMKGKRGLIMGVANDHSIAWGIARTLAAEGAERLGRDERHRTAIGHGAIRPKERQFPRPLRLAEALAQCGAVNGDHGAVHGSEVRLTVINE